MVVILFNGVGLSIDSKGFFASGCVVIRCLKIRAQIVLFAVYLYDKSGIQIFIIS